MRVEKWRVCAGLCMAFHRTAVLLDTGPFYPACSVLDEDAIRPARDVYEYVPRSAKYIQGRTTAKELRVRCPISLVIRIHLSMADGQGNDSDVTRS